MKCFSAIWICICLLIGNPVYAKEIEEPKDLYARSAVLMDADSGRILFQKNGDEVLAMASTTKIMTCILALEKGNLNSLVTVSEQAAAQPKVHLGMKAGEQYKLEDLLFSLMLESHNDSAVAVAEHIGGSVEGFAKIMNEKAKEIGCEDTYFITPNGLDATDETGCHATTAKELAQMMRYCITDSPKKEDFLRITAVSRYSFSDQEGKRTFQCQNHNAFLTMMQGALSGKTGFTGKAGYCYVGALERDGRTFVVALLACGWPNNKTYKWKDTMRLMEYAVEHYAYRKLAADVDLSEVVVENGIPENHSLFGEAKVPVEVDYGKDAGRILKREDEKVETELVLEESVEAPLLKGAVVGNLIFYLDGQAVKEYPVVVVREIKQKEIPWVFRQILKQYLRI